MKYKRERERKSERVWGGLIHSLIIQAVVKELWVALQRSHESSNIRYVLCALCHICLLHIISLTIQDLTTVHKIYIYFYINQ